MGFTWTAGEILVLMIFPLSGLFVAVWGYDARRVVRKLLAKAFPKCSSKREHDLEEAGTNEENSPKNDDPIDSVGLSQQCPNCGPRAETCVVRL